MQLLSTYKALYYTDRPALCKEAQHLLEDVLLGHCIVAGTTIVVPGEMKYRRRWGRWGRWADGRSHKDTDVVVIRAHVCGVFVVVVVVVVVEGLTNYGVSLFSLFSFFQDTCGQGVSTRSCFHWWASDQLIPPTAVRLTCVW